MLDGVSRFPLTRVYIHSYICIYIYIFKSVPNREVGGGHFRRGSIARYVQR